MPRKCHGHRRLCPDRNRQQQCSEKGQENICPLSQVPCDGRVRVCRITGNRRNCARMASLGVLPGSELELVCPARGGRCMVKVNGGTLSLDGPTADAIMVSRE